MKILESYKNIAKSLLIEEEDVMGHIIKYKDEDGDEKEITVKSALQSGDSHPAYQQARDIADKGQAGLAKKDKEKPKGKALGKGDFERDLDDDPTRGDPDDAWDDEEGRAKPSGGDIEDHEIEALISPLEVDDFIEKYDDKLSDEQKDELYDLGSDLEAAEGEMATGQIDDDEYEDKISDIQGQIANVVRGDGFEDDDIQGMNMTVRDKKAEAQMDAGRVADKVADKHGLEVDMSGGDDDNSYELVGDNEGEYPGDNGIMVSAIETDDGIEYTIGMGGVNQFWGESFNSKEEMESALDKIAGDKKVQNALNKGDIHNIKDHIKTLVGDDSAEDKEKMDPEKDGYAQTLNKQSGSEFKETVYDYLFLYGHKIPEESYNDIEKWYNELDSGAPEDREEELEQKIADEIEGLEANNESIKIINGKKYKPVKEEKKVTEKHPFRKTYERMGGK